MSTQWEGYTRIRIRISHSCCASFLRCGYSLPEIEEAAAISLNYRKQMTITKLMDPPIVMKDKVKNRFASCHETEAPTQRQRISRRNSNEPLVMPRREPDYDHIYPSSLSRQQQNLSGDAMNPARLRMQRRLSNFEPDNGLVRKLSNEKLVAPTRTISPKKKRFERRNSPTAELEPPTSPIAAMGLPPADGEEAPLRLPSRQISPNSMGRMLRRHHSAPLVAFQGLRIPVRIKSPNPNAMSPNPLSPQKEAKLSKRFQKELLLGLETPLVSIGSKNHAPSFPTRSTTPSPPPSPPPAERLGRSPSSASPLKPRRRLSPPVELQTEVTPNRRC